MTMHREKLKDVLAKVVQDPATEARWLNTLSLLEYVGARKIGRTMCRTHPSAEVLDHWADETRHAYAFKRLCERVGGGSCDGYLGQEAAVTYFQELDKQASAWATEMTGEEDSFQNYLVVTTLIERRAMKVYPIYRSITEQDTVRDELKEIIVEEQDHRVAIEERALSVLAAKGVDGIEPVEAVEQELFDGLLDQLDAQLAS